jgi:hypothetical protein
MFGDLTVSENMFLNDGLPLTRFGLVDWKRLHGNARRVLRQMEANLPVHRPARYLSVGQRFPGMRNLSATPKVTEEDQAMATQVTIDTVKAYPSLDGIFAITSVALPGAAEALAKTGAHDNIFLVGLSTPNSMRR